MVGNVNEVEEESAGPGKSDHEHHHWACSRLSPRLKTEGGSCLSAMSHVGRAAAQGTAIRVAPVCQCSAPFPPSVCTRCLFRTYPARCLWWARGRTCLGTSAPLREGPRALPLPSTVTPRTTELAAILARPSGSHGSSPPAAPLGDHPLERPASGTGDKAAHERPAPGGIRLSQLRSGT